MAAPKTTAPSAPAATKQQQPFTIYGGGRVGEALVEMGPGGDVSCCVTRNEAVKRSDSPRAADPMAAAATAPAPPRLYCSL